MSAIQQLITEHMDIWTAADTGKRSGRGRASSNAGCVYGVKKLRDLILELAVRGKLVPQDANDEPASELLKRVHAEKAKLVAEGKIKKDRPLAAIADDEKPFDLPHGWEWIRLGALGDWGAGATPLRSISSYYGGDTPWFKSGELSADFIDSSEETITELALKECSLRLNQPGDVLIAMYGATIGKAAILNVVGTTNQAVCACTPNSGIFNRYLLTMLKAMKSNFVGQGAGGAQPNISREKIIATISALPPLAEQHRIVAKVDELMALCDQLEAQHINAAEAHEKLVSHLLGTLTQSQSADDFSANWQRIAVHFDTLFTTEASIDALKQSLLQLAFMGKLVPQDADDEPASELLKRIKAEKGNLISEGKVRKNQSLPTITDEEKLFVLPRGWEWCRLQDITKLITDGKHGDCNDSKNSGYYFLSAKDIQNGKLLYDKARQIEPTEFQEVHQRTALAAGDICMVNTGATVGKIAVATDHAYTNRTTFQKSVAVIKVIQPFIHQNYITNFLIAESPNLLKKSGGSAINNLLLGDLKMKIVPLPSTKEQIAISAKLEELMRLCEHLKTRIADANQLQQKLADTMVEKAVTL